MIKKMNNGGLIAELGNGTLYTAVVSHEGLPCGVAFTNNKDGTLSEDSIVLQLTSEKALASFMDLTMRYLKEIVKVSDGNEHETKEILKSVKEFRDSIKHMLPDEKLR